MIRKWRARCHCEINFLSQKPTISEGGKHSLAFGLKGNHFRLLAPRCFFAALAPFLDPSASLIGGAQPRVPGVTFVSANVLPSLPEED